LGQRADHGVGGHWRAAQSGARAVYQNPVLGLGLVLLASFLWLIALPIALILLDAFTAQPGDGARTGVSDGALTFYYLVRAFASRIFPAAVVKKMGVRHVKGMLLYGPPGTGKTLIARQIGKMLNGKEPKIVNGPEILSKFVGESEANVRGR
jgi:hypothetical protein